MNGKRYLTWPNIKHTAGLLCVGYLVVWSPGDVSLGLAALIAGLLGLQDVLASMFEKRRNGG